jgi:hypothetical protein
MVHSELEGGADHQLARVHLLLIKWESVDGRSPVTTNFLEHEDLSQSIYHHDDPGVVRMAHAGPLVGSLGACIERASKATPGTRQGSKRG